MRKNKKSSFSPKNFKNTAIRYTSLIASIAALGVSSSTLHAESTVSAKQTYKDESTGLSWTRCLAGQVLTEKKSNDEIPKTYFECSGTSTSSGWYSASTIASHANIDGYSAWRLPTKDEFQTLIDNISKSSKDPSGEFENLFPTARYELWTSDIDQFALTPFSVKIKGGYSYSGESKSYIDANFKTSTDSIDKNEFLLVSDGKPTPKREYDGINASRFFSDPATGLTWVPKLKGPLQTQAYNADGKSITVAADPACNCGWSADINLSWWQAVELANSVQLQGKPGWRLPTKSELLEILPKLSTAGYPKAHEFLTDCMTLDAGNKIGTVLRYDRLSNYGSDENLSGRFGDVTSTSAGNICLVWSDNMTSEFSDAVARLSLWNGKSDFPITEAQSVAVAAANKKKNEEDAAYELSKQKKQQVLIDAERARQADSEARKKILRASPKVGMRTKYGIILQVNSDLVQIQEEHDVCVRPGPQWCLKLERQYTGKNIWIKKAELLP